MTFIKPTDGSSPSYGGPSQNTKTVLSSDASLISSYKIFGTENNNELSKMSAEQLALIQNVLIKFHLLSPYKCKLGKYNEATLIGLQRFQSLFNIKAEGGRYFSGQTLRAMRFALFFSHLNFPVEEAALKYLSNKPGSEKLIDELANKCSDNELSYQDEVELLKSSGLEQKPEAAHTGGILSVTSLHNLASSGINLLPSQATYNLKASIKGIVSLGSRQETAIKMIGSNKTDEYHGVESLQYEYQISLDDGTTHTININALRISPSGMKNISIRPAVSLEAGDSEDTLDAISRSAANNDGKELVGFIGSFYYDYHGSDRVPFGGFASMGRS